MSLFGPWLFPVMYLLAASSTPNSDAGYLDACLVAAGGRTAAARTTCFGQVSEFCLASSNGTTVDMVTCAERELAAWDDLLADSYAELQQSQPPARLAVVDRAQEVWTDWRNVRCGVYGTYEGSIYRPLAALCLAETTSQRVVDLWAIERGLVVGP